MGDKEDYLTPYRVFFENFAATVNPKDQLPVKIAGYTITESELTGEVLYWITLYLTEKQCPLTLMTPLRRIILDEVRVASKRNPIEFGFKSDEGVYIALRLMQAVTAQVNDVCLRYLDNSRLDSLPPPPPPAQRELKTVSCATKNSRRAMEDRHVEIGNLEALFDIETTEPTSFYAVYDGHAGSAAATYCAAHLHQYLVESPHFSTDLPTALQDAFLRTDAEFIRKSNQDVEGEINIMRDVACGAKRACGGSTAVVVVVRGKRLISAWAGDSLALLVKRMQLLQLVRPHKPSREDEKERIEKCGGTVIYWGTWRVNGQLAVSRAIGDAQYKPYVIAKPDIATVDLDGTEDFVVVASDGLWDFVFEDVVGLAVYRQLITDPDDLKLVTSRLIAHAKVEGSTDNISVIVIFLKDPRDIAAENRAPMDRGLDNALANAAPFAGETEACTLPVDAAAAADNDADADGEANNGVDNSDSDSEDLGPETAVDADDVDADARNHEPAPPTPPTPPAHAVEDGHVEGALVDNVAESGDDSEDEWNYFKGEGERDDLNPSEEPDEAPTSETPCHDNSAWETSSVDMNSSPLNPDAPVFIPGSVAGSDVLLAESPRKPQPMDDIELPDLAQFETEAVDRPAELLDLDNCDQLNGHHNASVEIKEHLNGNDKCNMESLDFGFNVGIEPEKVKDIMQDFERIQKDTTDFCNIQVFQTHTETNPFATEGNEELLERLKNKERDPMSMSFYQEKDDDTCERVPRHLVDLDAVQPLPDSDDDELNTNGICDSEKENVSPHTDPFRSQEPNNDILRFDERTDNVATFSFDNCAEYAAKNSQPFSDIDFETNIPQNTVLQTDTPESHKLLFEQIPEIPDGKSSELGFTNDDLLDPSESERDDRVGTSQEISQEDSESREEPPREATPAERLEDNANLLTVDGKSEPAVSNPVTPGSPACTPEPPAHSERDADIVVHEHAHTEQQTHEPDIDETPTDERLAPETASAPVESPAPQVELSDESQVPQEVELPSESPAPHDVELPRESPVLQEPELPSESPAPQEIELPRESPGPQEVELPSESPAPQEIELPSVSPAPQEVELPRGSPAPQEIELPRESPAPQEIELPRESPAPQEIELPSESPLPASPLPKDSSLLRESPCPQESLRDSPFSIETVASPVPTESPFPHEAPVESPAPQEPFATTNILEEHKETCESPSKSPQPREASLPNSPLPTESVPEPTESQPSRTPLPDQVRIETPVEEAPVVETMAEPVAASPVPAQAPSPSPRVPTPVEVAIAEPIEVADTPLAAVEAPVEPSVVTETSAPAPDLVQESREIITDIDVGVPESRAQEICVPVTSEIRPEDGERPVVTATPPPTPAVDSLTAAAAAVAGAAAVSAVAAAKKTPTAKKGPTTPLSKTDARTPKSTPKAAAPKTPVSAAKRPSTGPAPARAPAAAPRAASARTLTAKPAPPKPAPGPKTPPPIRAPSKLAAGSTVAAKPAAPAAKPGPKPTAAVAPRTATAPKPPSARLAAPKPAPLKAPAPKPATAPSTRVATTTRLAPRPAPASARPASRPATAPVRKVPEKKPLPNGDVKEAKPAPRPAPITRPAPRPAPRAPAPVTATAPPATVKSAAPKPATRTAALDKQSKDLANKRITAKAAPPRTAATKVQSTKTAVSKPAVKKSCVGKKVANGLTNGGGGGVGGDADVAKPPLSPPAHDNSLLPDVIA